MKESCSCQIAVDHLIKDTKQIKINQYVQATRLSLKETRGFPSPLHNEFGHNINKYII